jgi:hypothetical protein
MRKSYDELSWGCPTVWTPHPPLPPGGEVRVTRADMAAIAAECRRQQAARLRDVMQRRWPSLFWGASARGESVHAALTWLLHELDEPISAPGRGRRWWWHSASAPRWRIWSGS